MLNILYFVDEKHIPGSEPPGFLSQLQNETENSRIVTVLPEKNIGMLGRICPEEQAEAVTQKNVTVAFGKLFTSSLFSDGDMLMPLFQGEEVNVDDVRNAFELSDGCDVLVISPAAKRALDINLTAKPADLVKFSGGICMVRYGAFDKINSPVIDFSCPDEARLLLSGYACLKNKRLTVVPCEEPAALLEAQPEKLSWYGEEFFARYEGFGSYCLEQLNSVPYFIQYVLGYQLIRRFNANRSKSVSCPEMCEPERRSSFFADCRRILRCVDNRVFMRLDGTEFMRFPEPGIAMLCDLKKGTTDLSVSFDAHKVSDNMYCCIENCAITSVYSKAAAVRRVKILKNGTMHMRVFTNGVFESLGCEFHAFCDGEAVEAGVLRKETLSYFSSPLFEKPVYGVNIPADRLRCGSRVEFSYTYGINEYKLRVDVNSILAQMQAEIELTPECVVITDRRYPAPEEIKEAEAGEYSCLLLLRSNSKCQQTAEDYIENIISSNTVYSEGKLHIALVTENEAELTQALKDKNNVFCYSPGELRSLDGIRKILLEHKCDLVTTLRVGDGIDEYYFDDAVGYAQCNAVSTVIPFVTHNDDYIGFGNSCGDLYKSPELTPINFEGVFYKKELFFRQSLTSRQWESISAVPFDDERYIAAFCLLTVEDKRTFILGQQALRPFGSIVSDGKPYTNASEQEWYFPSAEGFFTAVQALYPDKLPITVQYTLFNRLIYRLRLNENHQDRHVITAELLPAWKEKIAQICRRIDNEVIADVFIASRFHAPPHISRWLLELKNADNFRENVILLPKDLAYRACDCQLMLLSNQSVKIELMDYTGDSIIIDCSTAGFFEKYNIFPRAELSGEELPVELSCQYAHRQLYSEDMWKRYTFRVKVPVSALRRGVISFYYSTHGYRYPVAVSTGRYTARLSRAVPGSYWICKNFIFSFTKGFSGIRVEMYTKKLAKKKEASLRARCLARAPYFERENVQKLMDIRRRYFATRRRYRKKNIWLTFDKLYKAGDNADYFYRYAVKQKDGADIHYVINKGYPDAEKFLADKLTPLYFTSEKHILHFLNSRIVATTHAGLPVFSGVASKDFKYLQDLFDADVVCIQHGLAVQWMPHNLYSGYDNVKRFYCATQSELDNLGMPEYDYAPGALRLTGLSRYDGLVDCSKKQILISPTWRSYIAMPSSAGNTRPYSETFRETEYFRIYNGLVNNKKLAETAERLGYHIVYLLHPTLSNQLEDFTPAGNIEVRSPVGESYEKIMTESDLMVTDFSGIQFDFAYMRKPIVYYHPDELPAGYGEGGFSYEEQAFGPICKTEDELVDTICRYMENECRTEQFYLERQNGFFAFDDRENCRRIYDEILEFSRKQQGPEREVIGVRFGGAPVLNEESADEDAVAWSAVEGATGYEVLYSDEEDGFYRSLAFTDADTLSYKVAEEHRGNYFRVRALFIGNKATGNSSNIIFL